MKYALLYDDVENGGRAVWDDSRETWKIPPLKQQGGGGDIIIERSMTSQSRHRPETEFARRRKVSDSNPRWRTKDIVDLDIAMPTRSTPNQDDPNTMNKIRAILAMDLNEPINPTRSIRSSSAKRRESKYLSVNDNAGKSKSGSATDENHKHDEQHSQKSRRRNSVF